MIPKRIRRVIVVGGDEWEYCVRNRWTTIFIHNMRTNEKMSWNIDDGCEITPKDIRTIIETKKLGGIKARSMK